MTEKIHSKRLQFLMHLRNNSREKLTSISKKTKIPISTLFDMLKELNENYIRKSTVILDFNELGYNTRAQILIKVNNENKEKLQKHLLCNSNVNNIFKINNGWNFMIETVHKNIKELDNFVEYVNKEYGLVEYQIHYLIDDIKREGFFIEE